MVVKTTRHVGLLTGVNLLLLLLTCLAQQTVAEECQDPWQPDNPRTCCDDLFYENLAGSLATNIKRLQSTAAKQLKVCGQTILTPALIQAYNGLQVYIPTHTDSEISTYINNNFTFCTPTPVLITGYYEPTVPASLSKTKQFPTPLYTMPQGRRLQRFKSSRKTIETSNILQGDELVFLEDPFTAFTIHIQGSAILTFADGSKRQIHYQGSNGHPYTSVGRVLIDQNIIRREEMSMQAIKDYTETNPKKTAELLQNNARFIYFTMDKPNHEPESPTGSFNIPLTPNRSIALDPDLYPQGLLFHLQGTLPVTTLKQHKERAPFHRREFSRFMLNQDSGSAIKGRSRVDLFMGRGRIAEIMAGEMQENGCLRVLLPK